MAYNIWTKIALSTVVLAQTVQGQPAFAQISPSETVVAVVDTAAIAPAAPVATVQDVLVNVCASNGYGEDCAKTLLGILWIESNNRYNVVGDHGLALGYFQIHYKLHNLSTDCVTDLVCSANWTIHYMEAHSYPKYVSYAVQCHNSCGAENGYAAKANRASNHFWDEPMTVTQSQPIVLMDLPVASS